MSSERMLRDMSRLCKKHPMGAIMLGKGNPRQCTERTSKAGKRYTSVVFIASPYLALGFGSFEVMIPCHYN